MTRLQVKVITVTADRKGYHHEENASLDVLHKRLFNPLRKTGSQIPIQKTLRTRARTVEQNRRGRASRGAERQKFGKYVRHLSSRGKSSNRSIQHDVAFDGNRKRGIHVGHDSFVKSDARAPTLLEADPNLLVTNLETMRPRRSFRHLGVFRRTGVLRQATEFNFSPRRVLDFIGI